MREEAAGHLRAALILVLQGGGRHQRALLRVVPLLAGLPPGQPARLKAGKAETAMAL